MILPRALLQGCCLSCLRGAAVIWGLVETIGVVCDPRAPWYGTCRSRVSGTHIASGHALLCSRYIYRGVCSGPGIETVWACSRGSVYTEILGALNRPVCTHSRNESCGCMLRKGRGQSGARGVFSWSWGKKALSRGASQMVRCLPFADAVVTHPEEQFYCQIVYFSFF